MLHARISEWFRLVDFSNVGSRGGRRSGVRASASSLRRTFESFFPQHRLDDVAAIKCSLGLMTPSFFDSPLRSNPPLACGLFLEADTKVVQVCPSRCEQTRCNPKREAVGSASGGKLMERPLLVVTLPPAPNSRSHALGRAPPRALAPHPHSLHKSAHPSKSSLTSYRAHDSAQCAARSTSPVISVGTPPSSPRLSPSDEHRATSSNGTPPSRAASNAFHGSI